MKNINRNIKIIFMGTPDFSLPVLDAIINNYKLLAVVTQPDKKVGRKQIITPSPIKNFALSKGYEVLQPANIKGNKEFIRRLTELKPDLIVVVAYGFILPPELIAIPKYGIINIHASLLPKYRGASPIQAAILNGDKETGVTIMLIDEQMDHGPILAQKAITISASDNFETLHNKLAQLGAELLLDTLPKYISGEIKPQPQDEKQATYCKLIKKTDGKIDWSKSAVEIERQVRAYTPWPGAFTIWDKKILKILDVKILNNDINYAESDIGKTFLTEQKEFAINCQKGSLLINQLQIEGKKAMNAKEFLNGYPNIIGSILR